VHKIVISGLEVFSLINFKRISTLGKAKKKLARRRIPQKPRTRLPFERRIRMLHVEAKESQGSD
jgi:hypothetical protein